MLAMMVALVVASAAAAATEPAVAERRYPIGSRGTLVLQIPAAWAEETEDMGASLGPYIQYSGAGGPKESDFGVELFTMWSETDPGMVRSEAWLKGMLESARDQDVPDPTEAERAIRPLSGLQAKGASLSYALRKPRNVGGGRTHVTNAIVVVGDIALNMTISTDARESPALAAALAALAGARLEK